VVEGPHRETLPREAVRALLEKAWTVSSRADRVGLRLEGEAIRGTGGLELISLPMLPGAIQVPPSGRPIVLLPDAPTVGGYPVPAVVAGADQHRAGQLRPGDALRFRCVSLEEARRLGRRQAARIADIARSLS
jgi:allophanate hydrolase subunit 2